MRRGAAVTAVALLAVGAWVCLHGAESSRAATRSAASTPNAARASAPDRQDPTQDPQAARSPRSPRSPGAAALPAAIAGKPMTAARSALAASHPPIVASRSIDQLGSPRERLVAMRRAPDATRAAQRDALGGRTRAHIDALKAQLATAQGADRARLEDELARFEKNDRYRSRMIPSTVRASTRPGATR